GAGALRAGAGAGGAAQAAAGGPRVRRGGAVALVLTSPACGLATRTEPIMSNASDDLKQRVERALAEHVAPALAMDGTQLEVLDVRDGVARIRLGGVCGSCPTSILAAVSGIEE